MSDLIHVAALGVLLFLLARMSLAQWARGPIRHPVRVDQAGPDRDLRRRRCF
jgi:hypothetical protein